MSDKRAQIEVKRSILARAHEVYEAWTDPGFMATWLAAGGRLVAQPAAVDSLFFIAMSHADKLWPHYGRYLRLEPHRVVEFTWMSQGTHGEETVVRIELTEKGDRTDLHLVHSGFLKPEHAAPHEGGWSALVEDLDRRLAARATR